MSVDTLERPGTRAATPVAQLAAIEKAVGSVHDQIEQRLRESGFFLTATQGLLLARMGQKAMTIGELSTSGAYFGSNVSYTVKKLCDGGYLTRSDAPHDMRAAYVALSHSGRQAAAVVVDAVSQSPALSSIRVLN